jgi:cell division septation protein DedD
MENRLKERLTGAAILVALVVMLVPEMFHGQRGDIAASPGSSGDGPPVRSYTIDLSNSPSGSAPLQSTPVTAANAGSDDKPAAAPQPAATNAAAANAAAASAAPANTPAADVPGSAHTDCQPGACPGAGSSIGCGGDRGRCQGATGSACQQHPASQRRA